MNRKNGFWNFCFSFIPGAGEMYQGFYKQGISLMVCFWGAIAIACLLHLDFILFVLPVVWFYSFFHTHNLASLPDEEFCAVEDTFLFGLEDDKIKTAFADGRGKKILAISLIVIGACALWDNLSSMLYWGLQDFFPGIADSIDSIMNRVPETIVAILIIMLGLYMIRGKKRELDKMEEKKNGEQ